MVEVPLSLLIWSLPLSLFLQFQQQVKRRRFPSVNQYPTTRVHQRKRQRPNQQRQRKPRPLRVIRRIRRLLAPLQSI